MSVGDPPIRPPEPAQVPPESEEAWVPYVRDGERQSVPGLKRNIVTGKLRFNPPYI